jgi:hypothetical protein
VPRSALLCAGAVVLGALPFAFYSTLTFAMDPFWSVVYGQQNRNISPAATDLVLALGPLLLLAALGLRGFLHQATSARLLILTWVVVSITLMYVTPVSVQRRFGLGVQPMLAVIAAMGLDLAWSWLRVKGRENPVRGRRLLTTAAVLALCGGSLQLYASLVYAAADPVSSGAKDYLFRASTLREAGEWLATTMEQDDVVLARTETGNYLAGRIPGRVFVAHWTATFNFSEKERAMEAFYRNEATSETRLRFLADNHIRYVVDGPAERSLGAYSTAMDLHLVPVYSSADVSIYRVP